MGAFDPRPTGYPVPCRSIRASRAGETEVESDTATATDTITQRARPWNVIVHDDPVSLMSYVVQVFREVFGYAEAKARRLMLEVHESGRSVVWTGAREQAELYAQRLLGAHLRTTLEQTTE